MKMNYKHGRFAAYARDPEVRKAWHKEYYAEHAEDAYARSLKQDFGITIDEYRAIFNTQDGRCAICRIPQTEEKRRFSVDHDHETGAIRGLLCGNCNSFIATAYSMKRDLNG